MNLASWFLLFLGKLMSFFRKRWDRSTRRLWYIFAFVRSRILPQNPKRRNGIHRSVEYQPANSPTATICASLLPRPSTSTGGGGTTIASPIPISTPAHQPSVVGSIASHPRRILRPMGGINRYWKQKVIAGLLVTPHVCPPVTTQFLR